MQKPLIAYLAATLLYASPLVAPPSPGKSQLPSKPPSCTENKPTIGENSKTVRYLLALKEYRRALAIGFAQDRTEKTRVFSEAIGELEKSQELQEVLSHALRAYTGENLPFYVRVERLPTFLLVYEGGVLLRNQRYHRQLTRRETDVLVKVGEESGLEQLLRTEVDSPAFQKRLKQEENRSIVGRAVQPRDFYVGTTILEGKRCPPMTRCYEFITPFGHTKRISVSEKGKVHTLGWMIRVDSERLVRPSRFFTALTHELGHVLFERISPPLVEKAEFSAPQHLVEHRRVVTESVSDVFAEQFLPFLWENYVTPMAKQQLGELEIPPLSFPHQGELSVPVRIILEEKGLRTGILEIHSKGQKEIQALAAELLAARETRDRKKEEKKGK